jgi:threonine-phosphate decarboxylase
LKKFQHGGDIYSVAKTLACKPTDIIDLSSNINFIKPKRDKTKKIDISSYPSYEKLYEIIAKRFSVKPLQIELFNGASSAIFSLFRSLGLKRCVIYSPAYLEYKKASKLFGYKLDKIDRFSCTKTKIKKSSLVVFVNPSTPDGKFYNLDKLIDEWIKKECTILIDESFLQFTKYESVLKYLKSYDKLYILKSFTKIYACAGVRLGTIISSKENIKNLRESEPMWKLSSFDMSYIKDVLKDKKIETKTRKETYKNRKYLIKNLKKYKFIKKIFKSDANYLLIKLKNLTAPKLQKVLLKDKIMIRDCSNFDFLDKRFVRVAIKSKKDLNKFLKALDRI